MLKFYNCNTILDKDFNRLTVLLHKNNQHKDLYDLIKNTIFASIYPPNIYHIILYINDKHKTSRRWLNGANVGANSFMRVIRKLHKTILWLVSVCVCRYFVAMRACCERFAVCWYYYICSFHYTEHQPYGVKFTFHDLKWFPRRKSCLIHPSTKNF